jgi:glucan phosphorylase
MAYGMGGSPMAIAICFLPLVNDLMNYDRYFVLADFDAYAAAQQEAGKAYADSSRWGPCRC